MPINTNELLKIVGKLAEDKNININVQESAKGASIAFAGAFIGALLGGSRGLLVGGTLGSVVGAYQGQGKYKSVISVIMEDMTEEQRESLATSLRRIMEDFQIEDVAHLAWNSGAAQLLLQEALEFIENNTLGQIAQ